MVLAERNSISRIIVVGRCKRDYMRGVNDCRASCWPDIHATQRACVLIERPDYLRKHIVPNELTIVVCAGCPSQDKFRICFSDQSVSIVHNSRDHLSVQYCRLLTGKVPFVNVGAYSVPHYGRLQKRPEVGRQSSPVNHPVEMN